MDDIIRIFPDLLARAATGPPWTVVVAAAASVSALEAVATAVRAGIAEPVLVGRESEVRASVREGGFEILDHARYVDAADDDAAAATAVALARTGEAHVLLKGSLRTDRLLRSVLDRQTGLRTGRLLSDVLLYEDSLSGVRRLVGVTDGGINPAPDTTALRQVVANAVEVFHALGHARPRVALLSATEAVTAAVRSTGAARDVVEWADRGLPDADVDGPLALDNALLESAAAEKGIGGPVAGRADVLVVPSIEAGNILGKAVKYLAGSTTAHVVVGARVPVLIPSRVESATDKLHSIALGVVLARAAAGAEVPGTDG